MLVIVVPGSEVVSILVSDISVASPQAGRTVSGPCLHCGRAWSKRRRKRCSEFAVSSLAYEPFCLRLASHDVRASQVDMILNKRT